MALPGGAGLRALRLELQSLVSLSPTELLQAEGNHNMASGAWQPPSSPKRSYGKLAQLLHQFAGLEQYPPSVRLLCWSQRIESDDRDGTNSRSLRSRSDLPTPPPPPPPTTVSSSATAPSFQDRLEESGGGDPTTLAELLSAHFIRLWTEFSQTPTVLRRDFGNVDSEGGGKLETSRAAGPLETPSPPLLTKATVMTILSCLGRIVSDCREADGDAPRDGRGALSAPEPPRLGGEGEDDGIVAADQHLTRPPLDDGEEEDLPGGRRDAVRRVAYHFALAASALMALVREFGVRTTTTSAAPAVAQGGSPLRTATLSSGEWCLVMASFGRMLAGVEPQDWAQQLLPVGASLRAASAAPSDSKPVANASDVADGSSGTPASTLASVVSAPRRSLSSLFRLAGLLPQFTTALLKAHVSKETALSLMSNTAFGAVGGDEVTSSPPDLMAASRVGEEVPPAASPAVPPLVKAAAEQEEELVCRDYGLTEAEVQCLGGAQHVIPGMALVLEEHRRGTMGDDNDGDACRTGSSAGHDTSVDVERTGPRDDRGGQRFARQYTAMWRLIFRSTDVTTLDGATVLRLHAGPFDMAVAGLAAVLLSLPGASPHPRWAARAVAALLLHHARDLASMGGGGGQDRGGDHVAGTVRLNALLSAERGSRGDHPSAPSTRDDATVTVTSVTSQQCANVIKAANALSKLVEAWVGYVRDEADEPSICMVLGAVSLWFDALTEWLWGATKGTLSAAQGGVLTTSPGGGDAMKPLGALDTALLQLCFRRWSEALSSVAASCDDRLLFQTGNSDATHSPPDAAAVGANALNSTVQRQPQQGWWWCRRGQEQLNALFGLVQIYFARAFLFHDDRPPRCQFQNVAAVVSAMAARMSHNVRATDAQKAATTAAAAAAGSHNSKRGENAMLPLQAAASVLFKRLAGTVAVTQQLPTEGASSSERLLPAPRLLPNAGQLRQLVSFAQHFATVLSTSVEEEEEGRRRPRTTTTTAAASSLPTIPFTADEITHLASWIAEGIGRHADALNLYQVRLLFEAMVMIDQCAVVLSVPGAAVTGGSPRRQWSPPLLNRLATLVRETDSAAWASVVESQTSRNDPSACAVRVVAKRLLRCGAAKSAAGPAISPPPQVSLQVRELLPFIQRLCQLGGVSGGVAVDPIHPQSGTLPTVDTLLLLQTLPSPTNDGRPFPTTATTAVDVALAWLSLACLKKMALGAAMLSSPIVAAGQEVTDDKTMQLLSPYECRFVTELMANHAVFKRLLVEAASESRSIQLPSAHKSQPETQAAAEGDAESISLAAPTVSPQTDGYAAHHNLRTTIAVVDDWLIRRALATLNTTPAAATTSLSQLPPLPPLPPRAAACSSTCDPRGSPEGYLEDMARRGKSLSESAEFVSSLVAGTDTVGTATATQQGEAIRQLAIACTTALREMQTVADALAGAVLQERHANDGLAAYTQQEDDPTRARITRVVLSEGGRPAPSNNSNNNSKSDAATTTFLWRATAATVQAAVAWIKQGAVASGEQRRGGRVNDNASDDATFSMVRFVLVDFLSPVTSALKHVQSVANDSRDIVEEHHLESPLFARALALNTVFQRRFLPPLADLSPLVSAIAELRDWLRQKASPPPVPLASRAARDASSKQNESMAVTRMEAFVEFAGRSSNLPAGASLTAASLPLVQRRGDVATALVIGNNLLALADSVIDRLCDVAGGSDVASAPRGGDDVVPTDAVVVVTAPVGQRRLRDVVICLFSVSRLGAAPSSSASKGGVSSQATTISGTHSISPRQKDRMVATILPLFFDRPLAAGGGYMSCDRRREGGLPPPRQRPREASLAL